MQIMARLRVEMSPLFTDINISALYQRNIFTVLDFLENDPERLVQITKLPYKDVLHIRHSIIANYSPFSKNGKTVYDDTVANTALITTGIKSLDTILGGGLLTGNIYEVCGVSGSGKTQLCLTIAMGVSHNLKQQVYYADTKMDFSSCRILSMLETKEISEEDITACLERIQLTRIQSIYHLFSFLYGLKEKLTHEGHDKFLLRVVIIDSLPALLFQFVDNGQNEGFALLNHLSSVMKYIGREHHISFILVNLAFKNGDESMFVEPNSSNYGSVETFRSAFGKNWVHVPSTRLLLRKAHPQVTAVVTKSSHIKVGSSCTLRISEEGVVDED